MKKHILLLGTLLICTQSFAAFSEHVLITPEFDSGDKHPKVTYELTGKTETIFIISGVNNHAWLVVCKEPRKEGMKNFRSLVWSLTTDLNYLKSGWGMNPDRELIESITPLTITDGKIRTTLPNDIASRAYVVIDFSVPVDDGGYYYTIDIPEFRK